MSNEDNKDSMTTNENGDQKQNHQRWKHLQPDQRSLIDEKDGQKMY